ncbi:unnamed protein product [Effrenium voratum]|nr:unnamed protein product [Effrenium voratum]
MGKKKKMIKVTKTLVEKTRRKSVVDRFAALHSDIELAEVKKRLQPLVKLNAPMTVRARLKGGCLRHNAPQGVADGNGTPFDPSAFWTFEPVVATEDQSPDVTMEARQKVLIKNNKGEVLCLTEGGDTRFLPASEAGSLSHFVLGATTGEDEAAKLGETLRIQSAATGKYLRVNKDGTCDGNGNAKETERRSSSSTRVARP